MDYSTVVISVEKINPGPKVAAFLEIPDSQSVFCLKWARLVDKQPIIYLENYIPALLCPGLETEDFEKRMLFSVIEDKYYHKLSWGRRYFKAVSAIGDIAFNLSLQPGTPVL